MNSSLIAPLPLPSSVYLALRDNDQVMHFINIDLHHIMFPLLQHGYGSPVEQAIHYCTALIASQSLVSSLLDCSLDCYHIVESLFALTCDGSENFGLSLRLVQLVLNVD